MKRKIVKKTLAEHIWRQLERKDRKLEPFDGWIDEPVVMARNG